MRSKKFDMDASRVDSANCPMSGALLHLTEGYDFQIIEGNNPPARKLEHKTMNTNKKNTFFERSVSRRLKRDLWMCMANGLLKKIALATTIMGISSLGSREARALPAEWGSFRDIVPSNSPVNGNPIGYTTYTSSSTFNANNALSAIYYISTSGGPKPIGGFDAINGKIVDSSFNSYGVYYGLKTGDVADGNDDPIFNGSYNGYWQVFYDLNNDGIYGTQDSGVILDGNEYLDGSFYSITNFTPYGTSNPGSFTFNANIVPEPSTTNLVITSLEASTTGGGSNIITMTVFATSLESFSIQYKATPSASDWTALGTYAATGTVTTVADTNAVPVRFYKAVAP